MEIERKWIVKIGALSPDLVLSRGPWHIEQYYLSIGEEEVRIRKQTDFKFGDTVYTLTVKNGRGLSRKEVEVPIESYVWERLVDALGGEPIRKIRTSYTLGDRELTIDRYLNDGIDKYLGNVLIAEIEFPSIEESKVFVPPEWFGTEVTELTDYSNQGLWKAIQ